MSNDFLKASPQQYPLGSIVFYCDHSTHNKNPEGITHVGIVVGYKEGSPQIVHAAHGSSVRHVVVSRLPNPAKFLNLSYVVAVPPKNININLVVALANFLATHARGEKAIIKYSDKRCEDMQEKLSEFYLNNKSYEPLESLRTTINDNIDYCYDLFKFGKQQASWFTVLAKSLNLLRSDFFFHTNSGNSPIGKSLLGKFNQDFSVGFSKYDFSHKGHHCVQFVVAIFQMSHLLSDNVVAHYLSEDKLNMLNSKKIYFSRKNKSNESNGFRSLHPVNIINARQVKDLKEECLDHILAVDGKMLSPAGLLHILDGGGPGGPSGSNGGSSGWKFTTDISFTGLNNLSKRLVDLSKHVRTRCNKVNMVLKKSLIHRINSLLELSAAQNIMKNILQRQFQRFLHHSFEVRILTPSLSSSGLNMSHSEFNTRVRRNDGGEPEENTPSKKIKRK